MLSFYLFGAFISFILYLYDTYKGGIMTVRHLKGICIAVILSWIGVSYFIFSTFDDNKTLWRKKK